MKIQVTTDDIDAGEPCNGFRCGLALALNRQLPGGPWFVGSYSVSKVLPSGIRAEVPAFSLPDEAETFRDIYDSNRGKQLVSPFEFELSI